MKSPIHISLKSELVPVLTLLICYLASIYFYVHFPEMVPTHWNARGEIDGWAPKSFGAFFFPIFNTVIYLILLGIPFIDPKKERYEQFMKTYHIIKASIVIFLAGIYLYTGFIGIGYKLFSINTLMGLGMGIIFLILGNYSSKIKTNWFIGIRTPWTLSNEEVWNKTHRFGGKVFIVMGILVLMMMFLPDAYFFPIFIVTVLTGSIIPIIYSYWLYKKITKS